MEVPGGNSKPSFQSLPPQGGPSPISSSDSVATDDISPLRRNTTSGLPGAIGGRRQSIGFAGPGGGRRQSIGFAGAGAMRRSSIGGRRQSIGLPGMEQSGLGDRRLSVGGRRQSIAMQGLQDSDTPSQSSLMRHHSVSHGNPRTSFARRESLMHDISPLEMLQRSGSLAKRRSTQHDDFLKYFAFQSDEADIEEEEEESERESAEGEHTDKKKCFGEAKGIKFKSEFHAMMFKYTESKLFSGFIISIILINTVMLISQTWDIVAEKASWHFAVIDNIFLGVYIMEVVLKIYVWRSQFFSEGWNILDFTIVIFNIIDFSLPLIVSNLKGFNGAAIFRLLRIFRAVKAIRALRVLRTIRFLTNLQVIMTTLLQSIRSISAIVMLITLTMYMFAVIGRGLYSKCDQEHFGSLFKSIFTLFQLLTLDDWFDIYENIDQKECYHIILYLMLYIIVEYFIFLNLFVAVLVDNFQLSLEAAAEAAKEKKRSLENEEDELLFGLDDGKAESMTSKLNEEIKIKKVLADFYPGHAENDLESLSKYFQILASLEHNSMILGRQQRILNMMVDICADQSDDL